MPQLLRDLKKFYKTGKRDLPWRRTRDPYKILVSEVMLQQTQVERVIPYYKRWIQKYPTPQKLAAAKLSQVLLMWQGLGYNRRGKYLWDAAKVLEKKSGLPGAGDPRTFLREAFAASKLPGVGPYTKAAVQAFAFNEPTVFIETNIRTVFFHHIYSGVLQNTGIDDKELLPKVAEALHNSKMEPREFYSALMDYGSHLKRQGVRLNAKSKHYAKQSKFEGSRRQKRAAKLRKLLERKASQKEIEKLLNSK